MNGLANTLAALALAGAASGCVTQECFKSLTTPRSHQVTRPGSAEAITHVDGVSVVVSDGRLMLYVAALRLDGQQRIFAASLQGRDEEAGAIALEPVEIAALPSSATPVVLVNHTGGRLADAASAVAGELASRFRPGATSDEDFLPPSQLARATLVGANQDGTVWRLWVSVPPSEGRPLLSRSATGNLIDVDAIDDWGEFRLDSPPATFTHSESDGVGAGPLVFASLLPLTLSLDVVLGAALVAGVVVIIACPLLWPLLAKFE